MDTLLADNTHYPSIFQSTIFELGGPNVRPVRLGSTDTQRQRRRHLQDVSPSRSALEAGSDRRTGTRTLPSCTFWNWREYFVPYVQANFRGILQRWKELNSPILLNRSAFMYVFLAPQTTAGQRERHNCNTAAVRGMENDCTTGQMETAQNGRLVRSLKGSPNATDDADATQEKQLAEAAWSAFELDGAIDALQFLGGVTWLMPLCLRYKAMALGLVYDLTGSGFLTLAELGIMLQCSLEGLSCMLACPSIMHIGRVNAEKVLARAAEEVPVASVDGGTGNNISFDTSACKTHRTSPAPDDVSGDVHATTRDGDVSVPAREERVRWEELYSIILMIDQEIARALRPMLATAEVLRLTFPGASLPFFPWLQPHALFLGRYKVIELTHGSTRAPHARAVFKVLELDTQCCCALKVLLQRPVSREEQSCSPSDEITSSCLTAWDNLETRDDTHTKRFTATKRDSLARRTATLLVPTALRVDSFIGEAKHLQKSLMQQTNSARVRAPKCFSYGEIPPVFFQLLCWETQSTLADFLSMKKSGFTHREATKSQLRKAQGREHRRRQNNIGESEQQQRTVQPKEARLDSEKKKHHHRGAHVERSDQKDTLRSTPATDSQTNCSDVEDLRLCSSSVNDSVTTTVRPTSGHGISYSGATGDHSNTRKMQEKLNSTSTVQQNRKQPATTRNVQSAVAPPAEVDGEQCPCRLYLPTAFSEEDLISFWHALLAFLQQHHSRGLTHGQLRPQKILLSPLDLPESESPHLRSSSGSATQQPRDPDGKHTTRQPLQSQKTSTEALRLAGSFDIIVLDWQQAIETRHQETDVQQAWEKHSSGDESKCSRVRPSTPRGVARQVADEARDLTNARRAGTKPLGIAQESADAHAFTQSKQQGCAHLADEAAALVAAARSGIRAALQAGVSPEEIEREISAFVSCSPVTGTAGTGRDTRGSTIHGAYEAPEQQLWQLHIAAAAAASKHLTGRHSSAGNTAASAGGVSSNLALPSLELRKTWDLYATGRIVMECATLQRPPPPFKESLEVVLAELRHARRASSEPPNEEHNHTSEEQEQRSKTLQECGGIFLAGEEVEQRALLPEQITTLARGCCLFSLTEEHTTVASVGNEVLLHLQQGLLKLHSYNFSDDFLGLLSKVVHPEPQKRFKSAEELMVQLEYLLQNLQQIPKPLRCAVQSCVLTIPGRDTAPSASSASTKSVETEHMAAKTKAHRASKDPGGPPSLGRTQTRLQFHRQQELDLRGIILDSFRIRYLSKFARQLGVRTLLLPRSFSSTLPQEHEVGTEGIRHSARKAVANGALLPQGEQAVEKKIFCQVDGHRGDKFSPFFTIPLATLLDPSTKVVDLKARGLTSLETLLVARLLLACSGLRELLFSDNSFGSAARPVLPISFSCSLSEGEALPAELSPPGSRKSLTSIVSPTRRRDDAGAATQNGVTAGDAAGQSVLTAVTPGPGFTCSDAVGAATQMFSAALACMRHLEVLDVERCQLSSAETFHLLDSLRSCRALKRLLLSGCSMSGKGRRSSDTEGWRSSSLCLAYRGGSYDPRLTIRSYCCFQGATPTTPEMPTSGAVELCQAELSPTQKSEHFPASTKQKQLFTAHLRESTCNEEDGERMDALLGTEQEQVCCLAADALKQDWKLLEELSMSKCGINDRGVTLLAEAFAVHEHLEAVNLTNNPIGVAGLRALCRALRYNFSIHVLSLQHRYPCVEARQGSKSFPTVHAAVVSPPRQLPTHCGARGDASAQQICQRLLNCAFPVPRAGSFSDVAEGHSVPTAGDAVRSRVSTDTEFTSSVTGRLHVAFSSRGTREEEEEVETEVTEESQTLLQMITRAIGFNAQYKELRHHSSVFDIPVGARLMSETLACWLEGDVYLQQKLLYQLQSSTYRMPSQTRFQAASLREDLTSRSPIRHSLHKSSTEEHGAALQTQQQTPQFDNSGARDKRAAPLMQAPDDDQTCLSALRPVESPRAVAEEQNNSAFADGVGSRQDNIKILRPLPSSASTADTAVFLSGPTCNSSASVLQQLQEQTMCAQPELKPGARTADSAKRRDKSEEEITSAGREDGRAKYAQLEMAVATLMLTDDGSALKHTIFPAFTLQDFRELEGLVETKPRWVRGKSLRDLCIPSFPFDLPPIRLHAQREFPLLTPAKHVTDGAVPLGGQDDAPARVSVIETASVPDEKASPSAVHNDTSADPRDHPDRSGTFISGSRIAADAAGRIILPLAAISAGAETTAEAATSKSTVQHPDAAVRSVRTADGGVTVARVTTPRATVSPTSRTTAGMNSDAGAVNNLRVTDGGQSGTTIGTATDSETVDVAAGVDVDGAATVACTNTGHGGESTGGTFYVTAEIGATVAITGTRDATGPTASTEGSASDACKNESAVPAFAVGASVNSPMTEAAITATRAPPEHRQSLCNPPLDVPASISLVPIARRPAHQSATAETSGTIRRDGGQDDPTDTAAFRSMTPCDAAPETFTVGTSRAAVDEVDSATRRATAQPDGAHESKTTRRVTSPSSESEVEASEGHPPGCPAAHGTVAVAEHAEALSRLVLQESAVPSSRPTSKPLPEALQKAEADNGEERAAAPEHCPERAAGASPRRVPAL